MRDYGKVFCKVWESEDFRSLSEDGRSLALYLLTCKHCTSIGLFRLPDGYATEDMQWSAERVSKGFLELSKNGFATRDERSKWVVIHKFLKFNPIENPNQAKAAAKILACAPENETKSLFIEAALDFGRYLRELEIEGFRKGSERVAQTLSKPGTVTVTVSETGDEKTEDGKPLAPAHAREPTDRPEISPAADSCKRLMKVGIAGVNPAHPDLLAAISEGATPDEIEATANELIALGKPRQFAYVIRTVRGRRRDALSAPRARGSPIDRPSVTAIFDPAAYRGTADEQLPAWANDE